MSWHVIRSSRMPPLHIYARDQGLEVPNYCKPHSQRDPQLPTYCRACSSSSHSRVHHRGKEGYGGHDRVALLAEGDGLVGQGTKVVGSRLLQVRVLHWQP